MQSSQTSRQCIFTHPILLITKFNPAETYWQILCCFDSYGNKMVPPGCGMPDFDDRCHDAGWVANRWAELLPIGATQKQSLLEEMDPLARLKKIDFILQ